MIDRHMGVRAIGLEAWRSRAAEQSDPQNQGNVTAPSAAQGGQPPTSYIEPKGQQDFQSGANSTMGYANQVSPEEAQQAAEMAQIAAGGVEKRHHPLVTAAPPAMALAMRRLRGPR